MRNEQIIRLSVIISFLIAFCVFGAISALATASDANSAQNGSSTDNSVIYEESFDSVTDRVDIEPGNNLVGAAKGWIFAQKSTNSTAYIENGRLYFSGSKYDVIYRDGGSTYRVYSEPVEIAFVTEFTVTFKDYDGSILSTGKYLYDEEVAVPEIHSKAADNTYTYTFRGWDSEVVACAGNAVYTAVYDSHYIDYTVIFKNEDGTVLSSKAYHYGDEVIAPKAPTKPLDETYVYVFSGWDKPVGVCTADTTYTATFATRYIDYTVTFKNDDGTVLSNETYHYGDEIVVPANPSRSSDTEKYVFAGWDSTPDYCYGDKVYMATYEQIEGTEKSYVGTIVAIVVSSTLALGAGGFSLFWFVIRKKKH